MATTHDTPVPDTTRIIRKGKRLACDSTIHKKPCRVSPLDTFFDLSKSLPKGKISSYSERVLHSRDAIEMLLEDLNPQGGEQPSDDFLTRSDSDSIFDTEQSEDPTQVNAVAAVCRATSTLLQNAVHRSGPHLAELAMCGGTTSHFCDGFPKPGLIVPNPVENAPIGDHICTQCGAVIEVKVAKSNGGCFLLSVHRDAINMLESGTCPPTFFIVSQVREDRRSDVPDYDRFRVNSWSIFSDVVMSHFRTFQQSTDFLGRTVLHIPKHLWQERKTNGDKMYLPQPT